MGREDDMEELSLELSIGGKYGKAENLKEKTTEFCGGEKSDFVASRCDFPGVEAMDPWRRREIQALRRQEARRKREEKVKKSRGVNGVGFVEDKLFLEAQRFQARARDREIREKDCFFEGKNRENGSDGAGAELGISLFSEKKEREKECLYPKVQFASPLIECDSEYSNGVKSLDQCSSAVSDHHSMSQKGELCVYFFICFN